MTYAPQPPTYDQPHDPGRVPAQPSGPDDGPAPQPVGSSHVASPQPAGSGDGPARRPAGSVPQPAGSVPQPAGSGDGSAPRSSAKRKRWPWIVGAILAVLGLGCVGALAVAGLGAGTVSDRIAKAARNQQDRNTADGTMNAPSRDGALQFTVTALRCGVKSVGGDLLGQRAQGEYCLVDVTVENVGTSAHTFDGEAQKAYDAKGTEFSADSGAAIYVNDQNQTFLDDINPGNRVDGKLVYDVPTGIGLTAIVLHESPFTSGVRVALH
jgi:hypothetical protein